MCCIVVKPFSAILGSSWLYKDVHAAGLTYKGKNTPAQVQQDAIDLCGAVGRDTASLRGNLLERGYDPKLVDDAINQIIERNRQSRVIK